jgi:hypothetical protein
LSVSQDFQILLKAFSHRASTGFKSRGQTFPHPPVGPCLDFFMPGSKEKTMKSAKSFLTLLNLACGQDLPDEKDVRARRVQLAVAGLLTSLVFAAIWGLAAGSSEISQALTNLIKVPAVILISALGAIPAGMLCWKLTGTKVKGTEFLMYFSTGVFAGTMVLAVLSPLVALYYHSSAWAGPALAMASVFLSLAVAVVIFTRGIYRKAGKVGERKLATLPVLVFVAIQVASLLQLIAVASPILPEHTVFDGGIDRMVSK